MGDPAGSAQPRNDVAASTHTYVITLDRVGERPLSDAFSPTVRIDTWSVEGIAPPLKATWPSISCGDCRLRNGIMLIYDDGTYDWQADIMSTDTNDVWYQWFRWLDASKTEIARCKETFMSIGDSNTWKRWHWLRNPKRPETPILKDNFDRIAFVESKCRC